MNTPIRVCAYCGAPLLLRRLKTYCSKACLCRANNAAKMRWTDSQIIDALRRYVAEFGPLPGSSRYMRRIAGRTDYPDDNTIESHFISLRRAGEAAGVELDPYWRDWTTAELDTLHETAGVVPSLMHIARRLGRTRSGVQSQLREAGLLVQSMQGCYTALEVGAWLHYEPGTVARMARMGILPGARKSGRSWQIPAGSLLAAEGLLYRSRDDLDPEVWRLIAADARLLPQHHKARVLAWQADREEGRMYLWRDGQIGAWWDARTLAVRRMA